MFGSRWICGSGEGRLGPGGRGKVSATGPSDRLFAGSSPLQKAALAKSLSTFPVISREVGFRKQVERLLSQLPR